MIIINPVNKYFAHFGTCGYNKKFINTFGIYKNFILDFYEDYYEYNKLKKNYNLCYYKFSILNSIRYLNFSGDFCNYNDNMDVEYDKNGKSKYYTYIDYIFYDY